MQPVPVLVKRLPGVFPQTGPRGSSLTSKLWKNMNSKTIWIMLKGDQEFIEKCILILYKEQTQHEQSLKDSLEHNGVGFTKGDAPIMTTLAEQLMRGIHLSPLQIEVHAGKMLKYSRQLTRYFPDVE